MDAPENGQGRPETEVRAMEEQLLLRLLVIALLEREDWPRIEAELGELVRHRLDRWMRSIRLPELLARDPHFGEPD